MAAHEVPDVPMHPDDSLTIEDFIRPNSSPDAMTELAKVVYANGGANVTRGIDDGAQELGFTPQEVQARRHAIEVARQRVIDETNN